MPLGLVVVAHIAVCDVSAIHPIWNSVSGTRQVWTRCHFQIEVCAICVAGSKVILSSRESSAVDSLPVSRLSLECYHQTSIFNATVGKLSPLAQKAIPWSKKYPSRGINRVRRDRKQETENAKEKRHELKRRLKQEQEAKRSAFSCLLMVLRVSKNGA
jgi:hypothetical protein